MRTHFVFLAITTIMKMGENDATSLAKRFGLLREPELKTKRRRPVIARLDTIGNPTFILFLP